MIFQAQGKFRKNKKIEKISKNKEISNFIEEKDKKFMGWRGTLRVLRAETWLTVYRTIAIRVQLQLVGSQKNVELFIIFEVFFRSNAFFHY